MTDTYHKSDLDFFSLFSLLERELCSHCLDRCWDFGGIYTFKERLVSSPSYASFYCNIFVTDNTPCYRRTMPSSTPYTEALYQQMTADRNLTRPSPSSVGSPCIWFKPPFSKVISVLASLGVPVTFRTSRTLGAPFPPELSVSSSILPAPPFRSVESPPAKSPDPTATYLRGGSRRRRNPPLLSRHRGGQNNLNQREAAPAPSLLVWLVKPRQTLLLAS